MAGKKDKEDPQPTIEAASDVESGDPGVPPADAVADSDAAPGLTDADLDLASPLDPPIDATPDGSDQIGASDPAPVAEGADGAPGDDPGAVEGADPQSSNPDGESQPEPESEPQLIPSHQVVIGRKWQRMSNQGLRAEINGWSDVKKLPEDHPLTRLDLLAYLSWLNYASRLGMHPGKWGDWDDADLWERFDSGDIQMRAEEPEEATLRSHPDDPSEDDLNDEIGEDEAAE